MWCPGESHVSRSRVMCHVTRVMCHATVTCHVSRHCSSQGYRQQAAHSLVQEDQTRIRAERLSSTFTWGQAIYEGGLISEMSYE